MTQNKKPGVTDSSRLTQGLSSSTGRSLNVAAQACVIAYAILGLRFSLPIERLPSLGRT